MDDNDGHVCAANANPFHPRTRKDGRKKEILWKETQNWTLSMKKQFFLHFVNNLQNDSNVPNGNNGKFHEFFL